MMILGFQVWWVVMFYLVAQGLLLMHLGHGVAAMFQSFGWRDHVWWPRIQTFAKMASIAIFIGYAIMPIAIYLRMVGGDYATTKKHDLTETAPPSAVAAATAGKEAK
jgi:succinate dehydrogenase / fumarate reductase cytochrome b subunit